jgi:hypothetical protein
MTPIQGGGVRKPKFLESRRKGQMTFFTVRFAARVD